MEKKHASVPVLHQTDCFHFHGDPDDHWDLATQFALDYCGRTELCGVLIDDPTTAAARGASCGDPAIGAVSQMNVLCGRAAPVGVGLPRALTDEASVRAAGASLARNSGLYLLRHTLETSPEPVAIHIVGSARDAAAAFVLWPELFREKCRAVYLNSGTAFGSALEYNVSLDPFAYSCMFRLPCPLYWLPCFHTLDADCADGVQDRGTYWKFRQGDVLPDLSLGVQRYFAYALGRSESLRWLECLRTPQDGQLMETINATDRNMWSTAGFLHCAGYGVSAQGELTDASSDTPSVFRFEPVRAVCGGDGRVTWTPGEGNQFLFRITDPEHYASAMTTALKTLLKRLPEQDGVSV